MGSSEAYTNPTTDAIKESLKEVARYMISIGIVDVLVTVGSLIQGMINTQTGVIAINWSLIGAVTLFGFIASVLRGLDKLKHVYEKNTEPVVGKSQGIIPF